MNEAPQHRQQVAVVTGATGGIGSAVVDRCLNDGYLVIAIGRRDRERPQLAQEASSRLVTLQLDLTSPGAADAVIAALQERGLQADLLVNCAGKGLLNPFESAPIDAHCEIHRLNFEAPMRLTHALLPQLIARRGQIVNVASLVGFVAAPNIAALAGSKAALFAWSLALREELRGRVGVTTFCPGVTRTGFLRTAHMQHLGLERMAFASEPASVAARIIEAAARNRAVAFATVWDRLAAAATRMLPATFAARLAGAVLVPRPDTAKVGD